MSHFYAYLSRMKQILRWGLMRNTRPENDMEHTTQVAWIAHMLALYHNRRGGTVDVGQVALLALYHDVSEVITGDLATPIKYFNPEIKEAFRRIEQVASHRLLGMLPEEYQEDFRPLLLPEASSEARRLVKAADKLAAYLKCQEERKAGNHEFDKAAVQIQAGLEAMDMPEVRAFFEDFVPSFELTLDELN